MSDVGAVNETAPPRWTLTRGRHCRAAAVTAPSMGATRLVCVRFSERRADRVGRPGALEASVTIARRLS